MVPPPSLSSDLESGEEANKVRCSRPTDGSLRGCGHSFTRPYRGQAGLGRLPQMS